jgi:hypothetical protein
MLSPLCQLLLLTALAPARLIRVARKVAALASLDNVYHRGLAGALFFCLRHDHRVGGADGALEGL